MVAALSRPYFAFQPPELVVCSFIDTGFVPYEIRLEAVIFMRCCQVLEHTSSSLVIDS